MPIYRKKPVVISAFLLTRTFQHDITPPWFSDAVIKGDAVALEDGSFIIKTLEGDHLAQVGDYIIRGVKGELYPCKPDIFNMTYEACDV